MRIPKDSNVERTNVMLVRQDSAEGSSSKSPSRKVLKNFVNVRLIWRVILWTYYALQKQLLFCF